ncbi:MAG: aminotransferase class III-fold pyridoxal phosphate-dependent enzyme, partial [Alphaproteobacteria bacterium]|nr:aminotransferase class III-fold pyridoxal phosphate-dependent enzyme [Alphaproteobacteria bacterium]
VFTPGSHGSTFGGNALAAAIGLEALHVLQDERLVERSQALGARMLQRLHAMRLPAIKDVRGRGLWAGVELDPRYASARDVCEDLLDKGVLTTSTHQTVVRLAPPFVISQNDLDLALDAVEETISTFNAPRNVSDAAAGADQRLEA